MVDVDDLSAFVTEWQGTLGEWSKIIYNQTLHETLRQNRLYYNNVTAGNWNSNKLNILRWESEIQLDLQLESQVLDLQNRKTSVEQYLFPTLLNNCLDLPYQYLRNKDIYKVLTSLFPKINQFTCDKRFITFAQMGIYA